MKSFASLLTQYVEASGMKQVAIATSSGITYSYLHLLLLAKRKPSEQVVSALAAALHLTSEQTGELLASAGYAPSVALLSQGSSVRDVLPPDGAGIASNLAHRWYRLSQEIPDAIRPQFYDEVAHLQEYARYKYVLAGGARLFDLQTSSFTLHPTSPLSKGGYADSLDILATVVGELYRDSDPPAQSPSSTPHSPQVEDVLYALDELLGGLLSGSLSTLKIQPDLSGRILTLVRQGVPWEIRRRVTEALPALCQIDGDGALHIMDRLRLDRDDKYGVDIRRRVIEALPAFGKSGQELDSRLLALLTPLEGDDLFVALATIGACGDLQTKFKQQEQPENGQTFEIVSVPIAGIAADLAKIQRSLLVSRQGRELEILQYSLSLYHLLCSPATLLLSIREGLLSDDKHIQLVAARYLERALPLAPQDTLHLYQQVLDQATSRNVRRTVARALPTLLTCLQEAQLSIRTASRTIITRLANDSDIHIRRTVADYAMRLFTIDREFLLTILRALHQDRDEAIRQRLQPVALRLAQVWLSWYAETAGLVRTSRRKTATPFGE